MSIEQLTTTPTEADLEAEIHRALAIAFPWIPATDLKHQIKFSIKFGHAVVEVDGKTKSSANACADIIVYAKEKPLAVLELKRNGIPITSDDAEQGLSYARMHDPMPPLVVVTNGTDVRLIETHTGQEWSPTTASDEEFAKLVQAASLVASVDTKRAVEVLLGIQSDIWLSATRQATSMSLKELSGSFDEPLLPFVQDFLIPRAATQQVLAALRDFKRVVLVAGVPLAGKSNVLREMAVVTAQSVDIAVLFVEADGSAANGLFQRLANLLAATLSWPVSRDEVRNWLRRLSNTSGPALVLAIDGVLPDNNEVTSDIEELCSNTYGSNLRLVISLDDTAVKSFTMSSSGRQASAAGRIAETVLVGPLNDAEFQDAARSLWEQHRIGFVPGVASAAEMRTPWVLRAVAAVATTDPKHENEDLTAILPPMLGLDLVEYARQRFDDPDLRRRVRDVARAVLQDSTDHSRPIGLVLKSIGLFIVRNRTLQAILSRAEIDCLVTDGILKSATHGSGEAIYFVRLPELLASELALLLSEELASRASGDAEDAAEWLSEVSQSLPLGDIVAAQAIFDAARNGNIGWALIRVLLNAPPRETSIDPSSKFATLLPDGEMGELILQPDGMMVTRPDGTQELMGKPISPLMGDIHSWLILSHLVLRPFLIRPADGTTGGRIDPAILLELGRCPAALRGRQNDPARNSVLMHVVPGHGTIVCHRSGVVEPVTMAIYQFLGMNGAMTTEWIEEAIQMRSLPLLCRVEIALRQLIGSADTAKGAWAQKMIDELLHPALTQFPLLHDDSAAG